MTEIAFILNGRPVRVTASPAQPVAELLREALGLPGTKVGCGEGECGACTVLLDGEAVNSCLVPAGEIAGRAIVTIEGLESPAGTLHPVQRAFVSVGAVQCGYCTPGMILRTVGFLNRHADPTDEEIRRAVEGNICRCTGYVKIHDAIRSAAEALSGVPSNGGEGAAR